MVSRREAPGRAFALALGLVALISPLAVHLFLPVIPALKVALALSDAAAQFTFSIALFAMALATLAYGSLSDRSAVARCFSRGWCCFSSAARSRRLRRPRLRSSSAAWCRRWARAAA